MPKEVREHLNLKAGDCIEYVLTPDGRAMLQPVNLDVKVLKGLLHDPKRSARSLGAMDDAIGEAASEAVQTR